MLSIVNRVKTWLVLASLLVACAFAALPGMAFADGSAEDASSPAALEEAAEAPSEVALDAAPANDEANKVDASGPAAPQPSAEGDSAPAPAADEGAIEQEPAPSDEVVDPSVAADEGDSASAAIDAVEGEETVAAGTEEDAPKTEDADGAESGIAEQEAAPAQTAAATTTSPSAPPKKAPEAEATDPKPILAAGTYLFTWAKNKKLIVQSAKNSRKAGANVALGKKSTILRQRWIVKYDAATGFYTIVNEYTKKVLAVSSKKAGANVLQAKAKAGAKTQLWTVVKKGSSYIFVPKANKKLALTGVKTKKGYDLVLRELKKSKAQRFTMDDAGILKDGRYSISLSNNKKKVVEVSGYSFADKAELQMYTDSGVLSQKYQVKYIGGGLYTLKSLHSGKFVGVSGTKVVQMADGTAAGQQWKIAWNKKGLAFQNASTGQRMSVPNAVAKNNVKLTVAKAKNNESQRFTVTKRRLLDNGIYIIHSFAGKRALGVKGGSLDDKGNVDAETVSTGNSQKFRITYVKGGYYKIQNIRSGMLVGYAKTSAGANVRQRPDNGSKQQLWKPRVSPNGGIQFVAAQGKKVLDIAGTDKKSGANVQISDKDSSAEQRWWLEKTKINSSDAIVEKALKKARKQGSATNYYIAVDVKNHRTMIFKRSGGTWKLAKNWLCSVGAPESPTVLGKYTVGIKGYSFGSGYTCYYYTQFWGDYLFHSVKYYEGTRTVLDGRLGKDISEGCVRLKIGNAKWIYKNIPEGTRVVTYK